MTKRRERNRSGVESDLLPRWLSGKESICQCRRRSLIPGLERSPVVRNGNPLQYSCLKKSTDSGARQATVHEVTKWQWAQTHKRIADVLKKEECKTQKWAHKGFIVTHAHPSLFPDGYFRLCFGLNSSPSFSSILSFSWRTSLKKTEASQGKIHKLPASYPSTYLHWTNIPYLLSNHDHIYLCVSKDSMLICCC